MIDLRECIGTMVNDFQGPMESQSKRLGAFYSKWFGMFLFFVLSYNRLDPTCLIGVLDWRPWCALGIYSVLTDRFSPLPFSVAAGTPQLRPSQLPR